MSDPDDLQVLPLPATAPLSAYRDHAGARVKLVCGSCSFAKTYSPEAIIARLRKTRRGGPDTPIGEVAQWVQWPCPRCRRMRWGSLLAAPQRSS